jgi:transcriptional regulator GlxA family with amidase domain
MIDVYLLVFDEAIPSSITGVIELLNGANRYLHRNGLLPSFNLILAGEDPGNKYHVLYKEEIKFVRLSSAVAPKLIIIPSFSVGNTDILRKYKRTISWLRGMKNKGSEIASLCVGCYFLAESDMLKGKEVTSHWAVAEDMQSKYPELKMRSDLLITDEDGFYTSGGAFSSLKLIVYLIEKFCGREIALWISKMYSIDMEGASQAHFAIFKGQHRHKDNEILNAQQFIEINYAENISLSAVSAMVNLGNRSFIRRFKAATGNTPMEYLQRVRMESAKKAIEMDILDLTKIVYQSGYKDMKTFRSTFKRFTGLAPLQYKKKFARPVLSKY